MAYKDKAQAMKKQNEWINNTYDRINLTVPKGKKEIIQTYADSKGMSVNKYINQLIDKDMGQKADE